MSATHARYLLLEQGVGAAVFNFALNAAIAWLMFRGAASVPLWGQQSIGGDTIGTSVILPLLTTLIVTPVARRQMRAGRLASLGWTRASHPVLAWLPARTLPRGLVLGLGCLIVLAPPAIVALEMRGVESMSLAQFVWFKAAFAAVAALLVTPLISLWAIAETPTPTAAVRAAS